MKTIVVGYDETETAVHALERAVELAEKFDAKLIVTSVTPVVAGGPRSAGSRSIRPTRSNVTRTS